MNFLKLCYIISKTFKPEKLIFKKGKKKKQTENNARDVKLEPWQSTKNNAGNSASLIYRNHYHSH